MPKRNRDSEKGEGDLRREAIAWRTANDFTQMDVSTLLGLSLNAYGQWERGGSRTMQRRNRRKLQALMEGKNPTVDGALRLITCANCYKLTVLTLSGAGDQAKFCIYCGKPLSG